MIIKSGFVMIAADGVEVNGFAFDSDSYMDAGIEAMLWAKERIDIEITKIKEPVGGDNYMRLDNVRPYPTIPFTMIVVKEGDEAQDSRG